MMEHANQKLNLWCQLLASKIIVLILLLAGCGGYNPAPQPTPTMIPTPVPTASPIPTCIIPQGTFPCQEMPTFHAYLQHIDNSIVQLRGEMPGLFGTEIRLGSYLIKDRTIYYTALINILHEKGFCARMESDEIAVNIKDDPFYENYHVLIEDNGPRTGYGSGMHKGTCPLSTLGVRCPLNAPPLDKIKIEGRRLASLIIDLTPMVHDQTWCVANGMNRVDCPYGAETPVGMAQRVACEAKYIPYIAKWDGQSCDGDACWNNNGNPLQFRIKGPSSVTGTFQVCTKDNQCFSANCAFGYPVCQ